MTLDALLPTSLIRDQDLLQRVEKARGTFVFQFELRACEREQAERDRLTALPVPAKRRALAKTQFEESPPTRDDLRHVHSVLAICGLPYRRVPIETREFERKQGNMALDVSAGFLRNDKGENVQQPLPFGPKARLILMHLCSESIRNKSATIDLNDSFTGFVRELGYNDSGGPRGALTAFKQQLNALAACTMKVSVWQPGVGVRSERITPIKSFDLWLSDNLHQRALWPSSLTFSLDFYESLKAHALPVNIRAVRAFANSARTLDAYYWLGYRVTRLRGPQNITWEALAQQFRGGYARQRDFRAAFAADLEDIKQIFPKLPVTTGEHGIIMQPAGPDVLALPEPKPSRPRVSNAR